MTPRSSHHCDLQSLWSGEGGAGEEAVTAGGQGGESSTSFSYVVRAAGGDAIRDSCESANSHRCVMVPSPTSPTPPQHASPAIPSVRPPPRAPREAQRATSGQRRVGVCLGRHILLHDADVLLGGRWALRPEELEGRRAFGAGRRCPRSG